MKEITDKRAGPKAQSEAEANADTSLGLLDAAGEVFAAKGYEKATIRDIVKRAKANLNAVNYYFRDKRNLYLSLFDFARHIAGDRDKQAFERMRAMPPDDRLRAFVRHMLATFEFKKKSPWQMRLMMREMLEPTGVLDVVVDRVIRPRFEFLVTIVRDIVGDEVPQRRVRLCAEHIVAQCVHLVHGRTIIEKIIPELDYSPEGMQAMADHVTAFSLAALRNLPPEESH